VDADLQDMLRQIDQATERLLRTVDGWTDEHVRQASLLPGWSRGHVLTHIARNADALRMLLEGAHTGEPRMLYATVEERDAAIERGAGDPMADLRADLARSATAFRAAAVAHPTHAWEVPVRFWSGEPFPASGTLVRRLVEVELHHTDLGAGYGPSDWPADFAAMELGEPMRTQRATRL
jgi:maleylpyruvate isomerase